MRVILAAGGSGGHIFPSVALASELEKAGDGEIYFVSSKRRLDRNLLKNSGKTCFFLSVNPMPLRFDPVRAALFVWKLFMDTAAALYIIARLRPDTVVGFGGYSSGAIVASAKVFGIPVLIHEQNLLPGRANRFLGRIADRIAVSFRESMQYFPRAAEKLIYSGNPLRPGILRGDRERSARTLGLDPEKRTVLVMGGSQGSSFLNGTASGAALFVREKKGDAFQFIHLTGNKDFKNIKEFYEKNGIPGRVFSFLENIDDAYALADLAVSRAGAAAVFELAFYGKPMILVPYPNPANNQRSNAVYFSRAGAAVYREENDLTAEGLAGEILDVLTDSERRERMSEIAKKLSVPDAGARLAKEVIKLAGKRKKG
ncbi:MAG: undecaprenyldiphospho-muramoylpentapeptide beta-N-acetylglucosaminyltransferase [Candidatus Omnitrophota bacterium]|nr:undecaprenyldiphospho-muramoylpentapeptide beta-N-acetylglucosaminyltransferase [Candidatus Omnitrophota bacterium]